MLSKKEAPALKYKLSSSTEIWNFPRGQTKCFLERYFFLTRQRLRYLARTKKSQIPQSLSLSKNTRAALQHDTGFAVSCPYTGTLHKMEGLMNKEDRFQSFQFKPTAK